MKKSLTYTLLFLLFLGANNVIAQDYLFVDSIVKAVDKESNYSDKIDRLLQSIREIYTTKLDETISLSKYGYALAKSENDEINQGDFLRYIGGTLMKKGNIDSATVYYYRSLDLLEGHKGNEKLGLIYDDIARLYRKLEQSERALSFYDKALSFYEARNDQEGIARINNESGVVYQDIGDNKTAFNRFSKSLEIQEKRKDSIGIGYALEFLGQNQMIEKNYEAAKDYFLRSMLVRERISDDFGLMFSYTSLGEYYRETGNYSLSNEYYKKSNELAVRIKYVDIQHYNYSRIEENFQGLGDYKGAYYSLKSHNVLKDSLYNIERIIAVEDISTKYETIEKEKQILEGELKLQKSRFYLMGLIFLILLVLAAVYLFISRQKLKHEQFRREAELKETQLKFEATKRLQEERLRISRDLHDNIGAQLAFIISAVDNISYGLKGENSVVEEKLTEVKEFTSGTISELRDTIWAMNRTSITVEDLQSRIANFTESAKKFHPQTDIVFVVDSNISSSKEFTNLQGLNIYRIIQEATNNALKYASASQIKIQVKKDLGLHFIIEDNGIGFNENDVELGSGLANMRKRSQDLGSQLSLTSKENEGTTIRFTVPV